MAPVVDCDSDGDDVDGSIRSYLSNSLSQSFPSSALSQALHSSSVDNEEKEPLSMSCFADLCRVKMETSDSDDDLTSLDWLQDTNLLKNISPSEQNSFASDEHNKSTDHDLSVDAQKENFSVLGGYDPSRNTRMKPPYSFSVLIFMAIESSPRRRLPVKDIYSWIAEHFPYYRRAPHGWRNSVRHNLSLNKCFRKVEKSFGIGKGSSWCVDPLFRPNLLQAMRRIPYYPFQQMQMLSSASPSSSGTSSDAGCADRYFSETGDLNHLMDKVSLQHCFPFKGRLNAGANETSADDIDVANTLASLGNVQNSPHFSDRERKLRKLRMMNNLADVVCTPPPSAEHSYGYEESLLEEALSSISSARTNQSLSSPVDEVYEFDSCEGDAGSIVEDIEVITQEESPLPRQRSSRQRQQKSFKVTVDNEDVEEERKRLEGVNALLNLAANSSSRCKEAVSGSKQAMHSNPLVTRSSSAKQKKTKRSFTANRKKLVKTKKQVRKKRGLKKR